MTRRRRYLFWGGSVLTLVTVLVMLVPLVTQGASQFADPAFQAQWNGIEGTIPNFWGPLSTARDGQAEPYVEGTYAGEPGKRLVQYFDKARMELTNPTKAAVTNGLLTVELTTGTLQLGNSTFQQYPGAGIGIAGDPGQPGPTYASLGELPTSNPISSGSVSLVYNLTTNSFASGTPSTDPNAVFTSYLSDPAGRFGQNVPKAFTDFLAKIPGGSLPVTGYPISAAFMASITVNGTANVPVIIQAFERRVLTYTPSNQPAFQVEFGNIGAHYYQWRYLVLTGAAASATACATATFTPTSTGTSTATPTLTRNGTATVTPTATTAPTCVPYVPPTACATVTSTPGTGVATNTPTATVGLGTPFPTDASGGNVCATSTPSGTNTPTPTATATATSTPDATGTALAGTYAVQTSTALAQAAASTSQASTVSALATNQTLAAASLSTAQANATGTAANSPGYLATSAANATATAAAATSNARNTAAAVAINATGTVAATTGAISPGVPQRTPGPTVPPTKHP